MYQLIYCIVASGLHLGFCGRDSIYIFHGGGGRTHSCTLLHTVYNLVCKNIYARSDYMDVVIVSQVYAHATLIPLLIFGPHGVAWEIIALFVWNSYSTCEVQYIDTYKELAHLVGCCGITINCQ